MKAKLTLSIAATLALLLFCVVVTVNSPRSLAGEALGIDLPRPIETQWSDDHGGISGRWRDPRGPGLFFPERRGAGKSVGGK